MMLLVRLKHSIFEENKKGPENLFINLRDGIRRFF